MARTNRTLTIFGQSTTPKPLNKLKNLEEWESKLADFRGIIHKWDQVGGDGFHPKGNIHWHFCVNREAAPIEDGWCRDLDVAVERLEQALKDHYAKLMKMRRPAVEDYLYGPPATLWERLDATT